jgi:catechol 2,3-dioxygenase
MEDEVMKVHEVGHAVLQVRNVDESARFYRDVLGMPEVARMVLRGSRMVFFSMGTKHHDLALMEVGPGAGDHDATRIGLNHIALKVGESLDELREVDAHLQKHGIVPLRYSDHRVSQSIYLKDPDGITLELYVDAPPRIWAENPAAVATANPLVL